jgi:hypothetical protein
MPVRVNYHPECDEAFRAQYQNRFQEWVNSNHTHTTQSGEVIDFDEALIL